MGKNGAVVQRRRKIIRVTGAIFFLIIAVTAALPLWLPWIVGAAAKRFGATYGRYERDGYQRFGIHHVVFTNPSGRFEAERIQAFVPTVWVWKHFFDSQPETFLTVNSWNYTVISREMNRPVSPRKIFRDANSVAKSLQSWIPISTLTNGTVRAPSWSLNIPQATWAHGKLSADATFSSDDTPWALAANFEPRGLNLTLDLSALDLHSSAVLVESNGTLNIQTSVVWLTNRIESQAEFSGDNSLPDTARVRAESFSIPGKSLRLTQYDNLAGSLRADWNNNQFALELSAHASPQSTNLPALDVEARASGDTNSAHIESAKIDAPWFQAELPARTEILFKPPFVAQPVTLKVAADASQQPWFPARGRLHGELTVLPHSNAFPEVTFSLAGTEVAVTNVTAKNLQLDGNLVWPEITLSQANITAADGSEVRLAGRFDFKTKIIREGHAEFSGTFGQQFLPKGISFESGTVTSDFSGPLAAMTHSTKVAIKSARLPHLKPLNVEATWTGVGPDFQTAAISLLAGSSRLEARGSARISQTTRVALTALDLSQSNRTELQLQQPFQVEFSKATSNSWRLTVDRFAWSGNGKEMQLTATVDWPRQGSLHSSATNLNATLTRDFFEIGDVEANLESLGFTGAFTNGPISFHLKSEANIVSKGELPFDIAADISGANDGLRISELFVSSVTQIVTRAEGSLPIVLKPTATNGFVHVNPDAPLQFSLFTEPNSILWEKVAGVTGVQLHRPNLKANLTGTWSTPQGRVAIEVEKIQWPLSETRLPPIENLNVLIEMDRDKAHVVKGDASIHEQAIRVTGEIPLGQRYWSALDRDRVLPDWRTATAQLEIENAKLAPFADLLPKILAPQGIASAKVRLQPGGNFSGDLSVSNVRTRPIENLGPIRNIDARAVLNGQTVTLTTASAEIGGQSINADGQLDLNEQLWRTNGLPVFRVRLHGTNVPLARNASILLRSDFDLAVTNSIGSPPLITGTVNLRDSLFLADLKSVAPGSTTAPDRRPPYFSMKEEPWSLWRLNVDVQGINSFRVQTPLFRGHISTTLKLDGTLKEPIALGQVKIDSGTVTFPFGNLGVKQGFVSLTSEDPFHPQLYVTATGQRFGYEIKMEATGPADQPIIQLSSVPALPSDQIILMLTAGQAPRGIGISTGLGQQAQGLALFVGKNLLSDFGLGSSGEERLTLHSGEEISQHGRSTYEIEYKLTDRWSLIGEYDRFDQYNLNLKWKVYSK